MVYAFCFEPSIRCVHLCKFTLKIYRKRYKLLAKMLRNYILYKYSIHIGLNCEIGKNLKLPHPIGIVIGNGTKIGDNCTIYHHVTLGKKRGNLDDKKDYPIVGDNVTIFAGVVIVGTVYIGDNAIIAPNSVVLHDVEPNSIYAGTPAKKLNRLN